ncbi:hypothetical protein CCUS01_16929 [Colletotrichum cuscutae]|uniref:DUF1168-domain-containing protein n=1 Tax=Colletotrichum cuscutae TaxID=1209917 RepID=A0AAI9V7M4_9PEZI|nr:hypothetical protein CCUS01_16929 [Colletotrichum cuscutae]
MCIRTECLCHSNSAPRLAQARVGQNRPFPALSFDIQSLFPTSSTQPCPHLATPVAPNHLASFPQPFQMANRQSHTSPQTCLTLTETADSRRHPGPSPSRPQPTDLSPRHRAPIFSRLDYLTLRRARAPPSRDLFHQHSITHFTHSNSHYVRRRPPSHAPSRPPPGLPTLIPQSYDSPPPISKAAQRNRPPPNPQDPVLNRRTDLPSTPRTPPAATAAAKMSGEGPESIPTSADPRSRRPTKKRALTPVSEHAKHLETLFSKPDQEIRLPSGPGAVAKRAVAAPPEIVTNVQGSSAGAGSGEFHVYKASRRREYDRLRAMDDEVRQEKENDEFERQKAERAAKDEERTRKNREKRDKKKQKGKKGPGGGGGGGAAAAAAAGVAKGGAAAASSAAAETSTNKEDEDAKDDKDGKSKGSETATTSSGAAQPPGIGPLDLSLALFFKLEHKLGVTKNNFRPNTKCSVGDTRQGGIFRKA